MLDWLIRWAMLGPAILLAALIVRHDPQKNEPLVAVGSADATRLTLAWADLVPAGWDPMQAWRRGDLAALPDSDPRARQALEDMQEAWANAPTRADLEGRSVQLSGYVVPLDLGWGGVREFLLVPYAGACIHTPPPPANQVVHVRAKVTVKGLHAMDVVTVGGMLRTLRLDNDLATSGYHLEAVHVAPLP
ncbi:MAG: DUF3299 domain-containing protein [Roseateles sp.]